MHLEEDIELLRRYAHENAQDAFADLVRRHLDFVYAAALRRTGGRSDMAADVAQQAFVALARNASTLEKHPAIAGWLYTTTYHLAAATIRSECARKLREEAYAMHASTTALDADPAWGEVRPHLDELIEQLDDTSRDALVRRFFSNQKFTEMGAVLHVSEDAARMRVERALERLRTLLRRRGVNSTTAALSMLLGALPAGAVAPSGLAVTVIGAVGTMAAPAAVIGALNFMSTMKLVGITCGLAAFVLTGGIYLARQADQTEELLHTVNKTTVAREATTPRVSARFGGSGQQPARGTGTQTVEPFVPVPNPAEMKALVERQSAMSKALKEDTAVISNRIRVRLQFHALYSVLGLSREEIDRFEKLAAIEHVSFGNLIGTPEDHKSYLAGGLRSLDTVVTESVGAQYVPAFRDYVATSALRSITGELAANTYYTDTPLTSALSDRLLRVCVECRGPNAVDTYIEPATVDWSAVLTRAQQFLSPGQMQAFRAGLAKQLFDFEYERETRLPLRRPVRGL